MDTQLCKAKSISSGQWVCGYYVKGLDMYGKEIHIIFEPTTVFYSHGETDGFEEIDPNAENYAQRIRRKNFYLRNGFHETGHYTLLQEERFEVVCSTGTLHTEAFKDLLVILHANRPEFSDMLI